MPSDFHIDTVHHVVFSRGTGVLTHSDYLKHMVLLQEDPRFEASFDQVVDCRSVETMAFTSAEIQDLGARSAFSATSRRAFVASSDIQFGMSRMLAAYREIKDGQTIMVFRDMAGALNWLGLPPGLDTEAFGRSK